MSKNLFDFCIGNPPYQEEQQSNDIETSKKNYAPPVYDKFIDASYDVADKVELIHPARFLFNAGSTSKMWNKKMLNDPSFKVLSYTEHSDEIFENTDIKGGIAITYHDISKQYGAIEVFTKYPTLNIIKNKVTCDKRFESIIDIVYSRTAYRFTNNMHEDFPEAKMKLSDGHLFDMSSNIFERLPEVFSDTEITEESCIKMLGRLNNKRVWKYIKRKYVKPADNVDAYKVLIPQAMGQGRFGELIAMPLVTEPSTGNTETFISIGKFQTLREADNLRKYLITKFARSLLAILKVTQIGNRPVWRMIPLQDFTPSSDIDWSRSVHEIDLQLYKKYGLSKEEIDFIETHVKEMV